VVEGQKKVRFSMFFLSRKSINVRQMVLSFFFGSLVLGYSAAHSAEGVGAFRVQILKPSAKFIPAGGNVNFELDVGAERFLNLDPTKVKLKARSPNTVECDKAVLVDYFRARQSLPPRQHLPQLRLTNCRGEGPFRVKLLQGALTNKRGDVSAGSSLSKKVVFETCEYIPLVKSTEDQEVNQDIIGVGVGERKKLCFDFKGFSYKINATNSDTNKNRCSRVKLCAQSPDVAEETCFTDTGEGIDLIGERDQVGKFQLTVEGVEVCEGSKAAPYRLQVIQNLK